MRRAVLIACALVAISAPAALAYDPADELYNIAKSRERFQHDELSVGFQEQVALQSLNGTVGLAQALAQDPGRLPANPCAASLDLCVGDPRLYDWGARYGVVRPIHYENRNGAYISGHLWAPLPRRHEPVRRMPAVLIQSGDLAPEEVYWYAAEALARSGYVVMTFDPQGHGASDTFGSGPTRLRHVAVQQLAGSDEIEHAADADAAEQTEDALDFLLSRHDPLHALVDRRHVGLAGHSRGADAVSIVATRDHRVDAVVAWDNLLAGDGSGAGSPWRPLAPRVPALGMSADYYEVDQPYLADPDPLAKGQGFLAYRRAGVDSMEVVVRGGTHYEWSYVPSLAFGEATLRGIDMATWYSQAWFDKYLRHRSSADRRLLSDRWRHDGAEAAIDLQGDGNLYSFYYRSQLAIHVGRGQSRRRVRCDDLRAGCPDLVARHADGYPGPYSYLDARTR